MHFLLSAKSPSLPCGQESTPETDQRAVGRGARLAGVCNRRCGCVSCVTQDDNSSDVTQRLGNGRQP